MVIAGSFYPQGRPRAATLRGMRSPLLASIIWTNAETGKEPRLLSKPGFVFEKDDDRGLAILHAGMLDRDPG